MFCYRCISIKFTKKDSEIAHVHTQKSIILLILNFCCPVSVVLEIDRNSRGSVIFETSKVGVLIDRPLRPKPLWPPRNQTETQCSIDFVDCTHTMTNTLENTVMALKLVFRVSARMLLLRDGHITVLVQEILINTDLHRRG